MVIALFILMCGNSEVQRFQTFSEATLRGQLEAFICTDELYIHDTKENEIYSLDQFTNEFKIFAQEAQYRKTIQEETIPTTCPTLP